MIIISQDLVVTQQDIVTPGDNNLPIIGYQNVGQSISTDSENLNFPATNMANPSTFLRWEGLVSSPAETEHILMNISVTDPLDYVGVARHNFGSAGIAVSVEGNDGSSPATWTQLTPPTIPSDDAPLIFRFTPQSFSQLRIVLESGSEAPTAAVVYAGKLLVFEHGIQGDYTPLPFARTHNIITGRSENGNYLGRIQTRSSLESNASIQFLTPPFYRAEVDPFLAVQADTPFFFAWAPDDFPEEVSFAWLTNDPMPQFDENGFVGLQFDMTGIVE